MNRESFSFDNCVSKIVDLYLTRSNNTHLVLHQLDSYNRFIKEYLPILIKQHNPYCLFYNYNPELNNYQYEIELRFLDYYLEKPHLRENNGSDRLMYPSDARLRNLTYFAPIFISLEIVTKERSLAEDGSGRIQLKEMKKILDNNICIGKIPIMVGSELCSTQHKGVKPDSRECKYDKGGYFVVSGSEKTIISQERTAENKIYVFKPSKSSTKYSHSVEVKSINNQILGLPKTVHIKYSKKDSVEGRTIFISMPHIRQDIPIFIVFRALGVQSEKEMVQYILYDLTQTDSKELMKLLKPSVLQASQIQNEEMALKYLAKFVNILGQQKHIRIERAILQSHLTKSFSKKSSWPCTSEFS